MRQCYPSQTRTRSLESSYSHLIPAGKLEGFRKIIVLLLEQDPELSSEIYSTLSHLLDVSNFETPPEVADGVNKIMKIANEKDPVDCANTM